VQTIFDPPHCSSIAEGPTLLEELAAEGQRPQHSFFGVRVVLLVAAGFAAGFSTLFLPWPITLSLLLAWVLVMVWPCK
jgi:hypothetical protein